MEGTNEQVVLLALLRFHESNFHMLHWKVCGHGFNSAHVNVTSDYYSMCNDDVDTVAENVMRCGMNPLNYVEVLKCLQGKVSTVVQSDKDYSSDEVYTICDSLLKDIVDQIIRVLKSEEIESNPANIGIKSYYESLLDKYDLQYRYLNKRRMIVK